MPQPGHTTPYHIVWFEAGDREVKGKTQHCLVSFSRSPMRRDQRIFTSELWKNLYVRDVLEDLYRDMFQHNHLELCSIVFSHAIDEAA